MARLDKYIAAAVLTGTVGVLAVLVGLDALSAIIDEAGDVRGTYQYRDVAIYVALTLPRRLHEFVPFSALIGALIGLGKLASSSELVVVRAAGVSIRRLALIVLKPALLVAALGFLVGEYISPLTEQMAVSHKALAQRSETSFAGRGGSWNRDGDTYIHVAAVQRGGLIFGVTLMTFGENRQLERTLRAERGTFLGDHWLLEDVSRSQLTPEQVTTDKLTIWRWDTDISPDLLVLDVVETDSLPVTQLWPYARYLERQGLIYRDVELAFWRKVLQPLAVAGLVLVAMSFIFGPLREGNMGARIFAGVIVGVVFRISQDFFGPASLIFGFPALVAALVPIAVCWFAGAWLLTRKA